jgi:hypothetical protein
MNKEEEMKLLDKLKKDLGRMQDKLDKEGILICPLCEKPMTKLTEYEYEPTCQCYSKKVRICIG